MSGQRTGGTPPAVGVGVAADGEAPADAVPGGAADAVPDAVPGGAVDAAEASTGPSAAAPAWWRSPRTGLLATVAVGALVVVAHVAWLLAYQRGQPLDIDAAGYLSFAVNDWANARAGGPSQWMAAINGQGTFAPLLPAVTSVAFLVTGPSAMVGMLVVVAFAVLLGVATWALAADRSRPWRAPLAVVLALTAAEVVDYSRSYHFALPSAAVLAAALWASWRSRGCSRLRWAAASGVLLGLLMLTRTANVVLVAAVLLAVGAQAAVVRGERRRRLAGLGLLVAAGALTAATWYWTNWRSVWDYLTSFGYGAQALNYGDEKSLLDPGSWADSVGDLGRQTGLPHLLLLAIGCGLLGAAAVRTLRGRPRGHRLGRAVGSRLFACAVVVVVGVAAATSSRNAVSGYYIPLVAPLAVLAASGFASVRAPGLRQGLCWTVAVVGVVVTVVPKTLLWDWAATPHFVSLGPLGSVPVVDGRGNMQRAQTNVLEVPDSVLRPVDAEQGARWNEVSADTALRLTRQAAPGAIAWGFRHAFYNVNTVNLYNLVGGRGGLPAVMVDPALTPDTTAGYRGWLTAGGGSGACLLLTSDAGPGDIRPPITGASMRAAARAARFAVVDSWSMPDGRTVQLWRRAGC